LVTPRNKAEFVDVSLPCNQAQEIAVKVLFLYASIIMTSGIAHAAPRIDASNVPCAAIRRVIQDMGAMVVSTGDGQFERLVRDASFCAPRQVTQQVFVAALDDPDCPAAMRCEDQID
jgi:hypothetical protein